MTNNIINPLLRRGFLFLEDEEWLNADTYFEKVLDTEPENAYAYLGKLLSELKLRKKEDLDNCTVEFKYNKNYDKIIRFGNEALKSEIENYAEKVVCNIEDARKDNIIKNVDKLLKKTGSWMEEDFDRAIELLKTIRGYKNVDELLSACKQKKIELQTRVENANFQNENHFQKMRLEKERQLEKEREEAEKRIAEELRVKEEKREVFTKVKKRLKFAVVAVLVVVVVFCLIKNLIVIPYTYKSANELMKNHEYAEALGKYMDVYDYEDSREKLYNFYNKNIVSSKEAFYAVNSDGTVNVVGENLYGRCDVSEWESIVSVSASGSYVLGVKGNGLVEFAGKSSYGIDVSDWDNIVAISGSDLHVVGLKSDGSVVATGNNIYGQCDVSYLYDIVSVSAGVNHTVYLKRDGIPSAVGNNDCGQCDIASWENIVCIDAGDSCSVGLKTDGTVMYAGIDSGNTDVSDWEDIVSISVGGTNVVGLKKDGTVVSTKYSEEVKEWSGISVVYAMPDKVVAVKEDGSIVATDYADIEQIKTWNLFK